MKKWTQEELLAQANDLRPFKPAGRRRPDEGLPFRDLVRVTANRSGYTITSVSEVMDVMIEVIKETLENKQYVRISDVCTLFPAVKRARQGTSLSGGKSREQMIVPPRWEFKCMPNKSMVEKLKTLEVVPADVERIFKENK